jgi:hypothetical protein
LALLGPLKIGAVMISVREARILSGRIQGFAGGYTKITDLTERKPINIHTAWLYLRLLRQQGPLS